MVADCHVTAHPLSPHDPPPAAFHFLLLVAGSLFRATLDKSETHGDHVLRTASQYHRLPSRPLRTRHIHLDLPNVSAPRLPPTCL